MTASTIVIIGAHLGDNGGSNSGEAYVIFGKASGFTAIDVATLTTAQGFIIQGDSIDDFAGYSVSSAGDINGDGFDDIIVGAPQGDDGTSNAGEAYVIYGKASGFTNIDLTSLTPAQGFIIQGDANGDRAGHSVASAGDINNDGFDDIIVGAILGETSNVAPEGDNGEAWIIFGKAGTFGTIDGLGRRSFDLTGLTAADGFRITGDLMDDRLGCSVSSAGDVNNDGFDDIIIGARSADNGGTDAGAAYVVFGKVGGFANIDLTAFSPADGFIIQGDATLDRAGFSVSSAGDINGDGIDDMVVGAIYSNAGASDSGAAYVIFGKATGLANIDLSSIAPGDGFTILGDAANDIAGYDVAGAGDINGDGFDDLVVGVTLGDDNGNAAGEAYVIYGSAGGFSTIDLGTLTASQGFIIRGAKPGDNLGSGVAAAGDVNHDGFDDLIVGAKLSDTGGGDAGEAYVIFGRATGTPFFPLVFDLAQDINPATGAAIIGDATDDWAGFSVSSAGDVNNDGFDDVIVSGHQNNNGGPTRARPMSCSAAPAASRISTSPPSPWPGASRFRATIRATSSASASPMPATSTMTASATSSSARSRMTTAARAPARPG
jgi:hypothetical protein